MVYEDIESLPAADDARLIVLDCNGDPWAVKSISIDEDGDVTIQVGEELLWNVRTFSGVEL